MSEDAFQDIPDSMGMRAIYGLPMLNPYPEYRERQDVVIRQVTEPFWSACISLAEKVRVCVIGTPGSGKTTSIPYLIYLLLSMKRTVVYLLRTSSQENWYYEFTPTPHMTSPNSCRVYPEATKVREVPSLDDKKSFYVVDSGRTSDSSDPSFLKAKVIIECWLTSRIQIFYCNDVSTTAYKWTNGVARIARVQSLSAQCNAMKKGGCTTHARARACLGDPQRRRRRR
jgi:hypothetical protein